MTEWQAALWGVVICERMGELILAQRNARWMKQQGGYEIGRSHYPLFIVLHVFFLISLWIEAQSPPDWWFIPFGVFLLAQLLRFWVIRTLGKYWNTRIWVVPGQPIQKQGPYRYIRHPNYVVVIIELLTLPLVFQAYFTALWTTLLNAYLLFKIRIPMEEEALSQMSNYQESMNAKGRLLPIGKK